MCQRLPYFRGGLEKLSCPERVLRIALGASPSLRHSFPLELTLSHFQTPLLRRRGGKPHARCTGLIYLPVWGARTVNYQQSSSKVRMTGEQNMMLDELSKKLMQLA